MGVRVGSDAIRKAAAATALVAMVGGGIGIGAFLLTGGGDQQQAQPTSRPAPAPKVPTEREFTVAVLVSGQQCDPAGECAYTYTIEPKYTGMHPLPPSELRVDYRVLGGHQPQDGTFTVRDNQARYLKDVTVNGPAGATLTAVVVDVAVAPVQGPSAGPAVPSVPAQP